MGAISSELFSVIILVIMATTFVAPPVIKFLLKTQHSGEGAQVPQGVLQFAPAIKKPLNLLRRKINKSVNVHPQLKT
jgi:hypothetical protein